MDYQGKIIALLKSVIKRDNLIGDILFLISVNREHEPVCQYSKKGDKESIIYTAGYEEYPRIASDYLFLKNGDRLFNNLILRHQSFYLEINTNFIK